MLTEIAPAPAALLAGRMAARERPAPIVLCEHDRVPPPVRAARVLGRPRTLRKLADLRIAGLRAAEVWGRARSARPAGKATRHGGDHTPERLVRSITQRVEGVGGGVRVTPVALEDNGSLYGYFACLTHGNIFTRIIHAAHAHKWHGFACCARFLVHSRRGDHAAGFER